MSQTPPPGRPNPTLPRWVKVFGILFIVLILAVVALHLTGNNFGGHMPHMP